MTIEKKGDRFHMYLRHRRSLINYAAPLLGSKDDAEDIVQDAYLRFVRETADEHLPPKTYLFRIVRNLSFNKRSRRKLENNVVESADIPWWALPQAVETPEAQFLMSEAADRVARALGALPDRMRRAFELYRFEGSTLKDIAEELSISIPTAHRLVRDAMEHLKAGLDHDE
ncbi:RNA polymerase sigma factor [Sinorhizobium meliloti]|uniref:RNA polymerase sigma factor n=1 Tax=Rhizobium meliloti TaxID=382 RepID=UPI001865938F|nr:sigma-70 family RNA polymerase sigma factor [Sinorhizobium meliloti]